jgi:leader peptidase (prepilin peptidase)/N-methyltransferase
MAVFGLVIGSFLNVVIHRVPAGLSLVPRSRCPRCEAPITAWQNVPVLSWIVLRGRCASCGSRISPRYPLVEAGTALAFAGVTWWWLSSGADPGLGVWASASMLLAYLYLAAVSIALALIDLDTFRLPNAIVLPSILVFAVLSGTAALLGAEPWPLVRALLGGAALALFYGALRLLWRGGMGMGDVKLAALLGAAMAWLGWGSLVVGGFAAFLLGGVFGVLLMFTGRAGRRSRIPFGPWMILGAWVGIPAGQALAYWYLSTFLA